MDWKSRLDSENDDESPRPDSFHQSTESNSEFEKIVKHEIESLINETEGLNLKYSAALEIGDVNFNRQY